MTKETLEARALRQFDTLRERGSLIWEENTPRVVKGSPFNVSSPWFQLNGQIKSPLGRGTSITD
jgi:hypothetical protein